MAPIYCKLSEMNLIFEAKHNGLMMIIIKSGGKLVEICKVCMRLAKPV